VCGRRLESAWSNGKPAYRCRHGYTSATCPDPARPKNLYIREDTIMPRLAALAILQQGSGHLPHGEMQGRAKNGHAQITAPAQAADQIEQLRATGVSLIYDPATKTLRTDVNDAVPVSVG
jgi:site-specific DNA recombinase